MPDITAAALTGDRRKILEAVRDRLAAELDMAEGQVAANLARELRSTIAELDELPSAEGVSTLDELTRRRKERLSASQGDALAQGSQ